jgi:hypothetical protein
MSFRRVLMPIVQFPETFFVLLGVGDLSMYLSLAGDSVAPRWRYRKNRVNMHEVARISCSADGFEVSHHNTTELGLKIGFRGNRGLEAKLREYLGMGQDDNVNKKWVRRLMADRAKESEERAAVVQSHMRLAEEEKEENTVVVGEHVGRSEKQKKSDEREEGKRVKDKAVQREQKARAKAKGMME